MTKAFHTCAWLVLCLLFTSQFASAQSENLLKNPRADYDSQDWRAFGGATIEQNSERGKSFVVRNEGYFIQDVTVPEDAVGRYAVLVGWAASERIDREGKICDLPSLYGYMMNSGDPSGGRIYSYLHGQQMRTTTRVENQWTRLWGIFRVPPGTGRIRLFLRGTEAKFDDLGVHVFPTREEASAFIGPSATGDTTESCPLLSRQQHPCALTGYSLEGIRLGMRLEEVALIYPDVAKDEKVRRVLEQGGSTPHQRLSRLLINPSGYDSGTGLPNASRLFLGFIDNRVLSIHAEYTGVTWKNADDFIATRYEMMNLPSPNDWESVVGNGLSGKYLICNGVEIRFYAAPPGSSNRNYISITDTVAEQSLAVR